MSVDINFIVAVLAITIIIITSIITIGVISR